MENFSPHNPEYKKVDDLPEEERGKYTDLANGGFARKSAVREKEVADALAAVTRRNEDKNRPLLDKVLGINKSTHSGLDELRGPYDENSRLQESMSAEEKAEEYKKMLDGEIHEQESQIEITQGFLEAQKVAMVEFQDKIEAQQKKLAELKDIYAALEKQD